MLDIKLIREDPEPFRAALARRGLAERVDELLAADERRRQLTGRVEELRAEQNRASKAIGRASGDEKRTLIGEVAFVQFALMRNAMDVLVEKGFTPSIPPVLVREETMFASAFLPTDEVNIYRTDADQLYLVGTSEVSLAALHMEEILDEGALPLRYAGYSTCFRREAGSYGKDLGGMFRVHQFDKVEMFSFATPESSWDEHEFLVSIEEEIIGGLDIPYRIVNIAAGDLGGAAAKKYDLEGWLPGQGGYRELTSCSNYTDYGSRRAQ